MWRGSLMREGAPTAEARLHRIDCCSRFGTTIPKQEHEYRITTKSSGKSQYPWQRLDPMRLSMKGRFPWQRSCRSQAKLCNVWAYEKSVRLPENTSFNPCAFWILLTMWANLRRMSWRCLQVHTEITNLPFPLERKAYIQPRQWPPVCKRALWTTMKNWSTGLYPTGYHKMCFFSQQRNLW